MKYTKENLFKFKLPKDKKLLGQGSYGTVYKISPRRVIKIYDGYTSFETNLKVLNDEIKNAPKFKNGLMPLKIVEVKFRGKKYPASIKRYLPLNVKYKEVKHLCKHKFDKIDFASCQYKKDYRGNIYRVDTQCIFF